MWIKNLATLLSNWLIKHEVKHEDVKGGVMTIRETGAHIAGLAGSEKR